MSASSSLRCLAVRSPSRTAASSRILMLTSWSEQSTPAELSIASVLILPPAAAQLARVHPHRVVRLVAGVAVRLVARLDVGADAAVPEQVHRRPQQRPDQVVRRELLVLHAESR